MLKKRIKELGADQALIDTWLKMALGDKATGRDPDFRWFREILDRLDGPVTADRASEMNSVQGPPPGINFNRLDERVARNDGTEDDPGGGPSTNGD